MQALTVLRKLRLGLASLALGVLIGTPAPGQAPSSPPSAPAPAANAPAESRPVSLSEETKRLRAKLDGIKVQLEQLEATLARPDLRDSDLQRVRQDTDPIIDQTRTLIDDLEPRLAAARVRLEQLGPKPKEGEPEESPDVQRDRTEREAAVAEIGETQRLARALLVQAEQIVTQASDRRRAAFARALFERSSSLVSLDLWSAVLRSLPRDMAAVELLLASWGETFERNATAGALGVLAFSIGVAIALYVGRRHLAPRLVTRDPDATPPRPRRLFAALAVFVLGAAPAAAGSYLVYVVFDAIDLAPVRIERVMGAALGGLAFVAFCKALADAILAPGKSGWRLVPLGDAPASRTAAAVVVIASVIAIGKTLETLNQVIAAGFAITVATRGIFALLAALVLAELLRRFATAASVEEECFGPYVPSDSEVRGPIRMMGWMAVAAIVASVLAGYIALASFLVDQLVWICIVLALLLLAIVLVDELIAHSLRAPTRVATLLQANTGLRRRSLEQIGVLVSGVARVVLITTALMLVLAPWGVDSLDVMSSIRAAFFGFKVGDVTVSLSTLIVALLIFVIGFAVTRIVQRWLDTTFLPATDLDAGLRNSIRTAFGYLGFFVAGALAFSYLGLSLDKIAIVAGALSVGIGFGLQSIVNNFVSGLILLWERPIRVGDLVVVGDGEGHVRKISVRATEIETFDRSTIIVPNSNLISGVVKNRVRVDRTGRVVLSVNVLRNQDPARAAEILTACASAHPDVLKEPPPRVVFKKIGDTFLEFELIAYVADVNVQQTVLSDLNFAVFKELNGAGVIPPMGPPSLVVQGLTPVESALSQIAEAIAGAQRSERSSAPGGSETKPEPAGSRSTRLKASAGN